MVVVGSNVSIGRHRILLLSKGSGGLPDLRSASHPPNMLEANINVAVPRLLQNPGRGREAIMAETRRPFGT